MGKPLPKYILAKLTHAEHKKLETLQDKSDTAGADMEMYHADYVKASRNNLSDPRLPKLADKGFKYEFLAFQAGDKVTAYKNLLRKKYTK
jgi:hypothetical protein